jgi:hypothetical protein
LQVERFQEPAPGVFVAERIRRILKRPEFPQPLEQETTIQLGDLNRPIPDSALQLVFPRGALIGNERDETFLIWGNGKPAMTFASQREFRAWRSHQFVHRHSAKPPRWTQPAGIAGLTGLAIVLLILVARRIRSARS